MAFCVTSTPKAFNWPVSHSEFVSTREEVSNSLPIAIISAFMEVIGAELEATEPFNSGGDAVQRVRGRDGQIAAGREGQSDDIGPCQE